MFPQCSHMASVFKRPNSQYFYAAFRIPLANAVGRRAWKLVKKVTKSTTEREAKKAAAAMEDAALREAGAGDEGSRRILAILNEAGQKAAQKRLTAELGRDYLRRLIEASTGETLPAEKTIRGWLNEWLAMKSTGAKPATMARYRTSVHAFIRHLGDDSDMPLDTLTLSKVRVFRDKLASEGRTANTTNHYIKDIHGAMLAAAKEGIIQRSPAENLNALTEDDSTERKPFTFTEIGKLLRASPTKDWQGIILLGAFGGMRLGDAATLKCGGIDLHTGLIRFIPQKSSRRGRKAEVVLPMHAELNRYFENHKLSADADAPAFPTLARLSVAGNKGLSARFIDIMMSAGVSRGKTREHVKGSVGRSSHARSFHSLRHTFNSSMFNGGVTQETRMKLVGHADTATNTRYTHAEIEALKRAVDTVPGIPARVASKKRKPA